MVRGILSALCLRAVAKHSRHRILFIYGSLFIVFLLVIHSLKENLDVYFS